MFGFVRPLNLFLYFIETRQTRRGDNPTLTGETGQRSFKVAVRHITRTLLPSLAALGEKKVTNNSWSAGHEASDLTTTPTVAS